MKTIQILALALMSLGTIRGQTVVQVHDADTYKVLYQGTVQTVRLKNVDAPEIGQFYGTNSRDSVATLHSVMVYSLRFLGLDHYRSLLNTERNNVGFDLVSKSEG